MYDHGRGVAQDDAQAVTLYRKVCAGGDLYGCTALGLMYEEGRGIELNYKQAMVLYRKACGGKEVSGFLRPTISLDTHLGHTAPH